MIYSTKRTIQDPTLKNSQLNKNRNPFENIISQFIMSKNVAASELISKFLLGQLTDTEKNQLKKWVNHSEENRSKFLEITDENNLMKFVRTYFNANQRSTRK